MGARGSQGLLRWVKFRIAKHQRLGYDSPMEAELTRYRGEAIEQDIKEMLDEVRQWVERKTSKGRKA